MVVISKMLSFAKKMYLQIILIIVDSGNVFKSFCIFTLALWSPFAASSISWQNIRHFRHFCLKHSDNPGNIWATQMESLCLSSFHWSQGFYDWFAFHIFLCLSVFNQICFTVRKNLTIYYCILRNKPTTPSIQGNFISAIEGIIEEPYFQCKILSNTRP